ncbi:hypothetical protein CISG_06044 [Coccidioides immitis RMSCC 3703]|uniref:Uncharacterized protein n=1 Tax=Coccidioides immitis RMSCC 3703 TaxID=454286 RepID=A0A0J8QYT2_COCIT|nr:hypothetical protein CISG_06044 [Coccidioides immitis RMSCC 3703]
MFSSSICRMARAPTVSLPAVRRAHAPSSSQAPPVISPLLEPSSGDIRLPNLQFLLAMAPEASMLPHRPQPKAYPCRLLLFYSPSNVCNHDCTSGINLRSILYHFFSEEASESSAKRRNLHDSFGCKRY